MRHALRQLALILALLPAGTALAADCKVVFARESKNQRACEVRKDCERFANSGRTPHLMRYRQCMAQCALEQSKEYQDCYGELLVYMNQNGLN